jgi:DNA-binding transcriptional ArsR family regulator
MAGGSEAREPWFPDDIRIIDDLETLQVAADPLRLRVLALLRRAPRTVKEIAADLDIAATKLYYHMKLLEERGLIRVAGVRQGAGPAEKEYGVTAYRLSVDRALLSSGGPAGADALDTFLSVVLDHAGSEIARGVRAGLIDPDRRDLAAGGLVLGRLWLRLTPPEAEAFQARLKTLEQEFAALHPPGADDGDDVQLYEMLLGLYPTLPPDTRGTGDSS